ncbi:curlin repeat-containing protein [Bradyrhizobium sp. BWA-3-5]|uniref:curlin repeat-containing protein n=1 Tax=Bradyrhizobium sp. BWA-3-5 TaxID=3080013 RepID=UPI00293E9F9C|nr:curlin repeat-containing protein [Bradyrhizobium sp. BWA-3-5]WOH68024.1 curlin repeat-containing protein [Bradyrhizobium sp. BWA-3-5]
MRTHILILAAVLAAANTPSLAGEVFVPQIGGNRQLASGFKWPTDVISAAKVAAPIKVNALAAATSNALPPNANVSSVTQVGTNNFAMVAQTGGNNLSAVVQQGSGNQAIVTQRR